jgi:hypothetical protein
VNSASVSRRREGVGGARAPRAGGTLIELLVALPLAMLAGVCAAMLLTRYAAGARESDARLSAERELRHAVRVMLADLAPLHGTDLVAWSDTLLEVQAQLGLMLACATEAGSVVVGGAWPEDDASVMGNLRAGDTMRIWEPSRLLVDSPASRELVVTATAVALTPGPCGALQRVPRWRVAVGEPVPLLAGGPVLLRRAVRYQHYRSAGKWWLGRRTREASAWETVQPVAGPLRSPAGGGMRVTALDRRGHVSGIADSVVVVRLVLRADVPPGRAALPMDSARMDVLLQAAAWGRGTP